MTSVVIKEIAVGQTPLAFAALRALRPSFVDEQALVRRIDDTQRPEGYRLVGVFEAEQASSVAVAGFRLVHNLVAGRFLYVDDLSTLEGSRGKGHGGALLEWLLGEARRLGATSCIWTPASDPSEPRRIGCTSTAGT